MMNQEITGNNLTPLVLDYDTKLQFPFYPERSWSYYTAKKTTNVDLCWDIMSEQYHDSHELFIVMFYLFTLACYWATCDAIQGFIYLVFRLKDLT